MNARPPQSLENLVYIDNASPTGQVFSPRVLSVSRNSHNVDSRVVVREFNRPTPLGTGTRLQIRMAADGGQHIERGHKTESYITAIEGTHVPSVRYFHQEQVQREQLLPEEAVVLNPPLTRDNLEEARNDKKWIRVRWCLLISCVLSILFLVLGAAWIVRTAPACTKVVPKWWQNGLVYQLWIPSFQDSDANGYGDLDGVGNRLSQLKEIGVTAVFPRSLIWTEETGHGVLDYKKVAENVGGMDKARKLIQQVHKQGLKMIIDLPVVATSDQHEWFQRSTRGSLLENFKYANYYYWKRNVEPSDYVDHYKNSSVLYFHIKERPDLPILNWKNENVSTSVKDAISFWIDQNVDGFHLGFVEHLARTPDGQSADWPEIVKIIKGIRNHVDNYANYSSGGTDKEIFLMASPEPIKEEEKRLLQVEGGLDAVVNTELLNIAQSNKICYQSEYSVAGCFNEILSDLLVFHAYDGVYPIWELGNSFTSRLTSRVERRQAELMTMVQLLLPGTSMVYYGEEIGMADVEGASISSQRGVMQWDETANAGFTTAKSPKMPFSTHFKRLNFGVQSDDHHSQLHTFKVLAKLRKDNRVFVTGQTYISKPYNSAFSICRFEHKDNTTCGKVYVGVVNFNTQPVDHHLSDLPPLSQNKNLEGHVLAVSSNSKNWAVNDKVDLSDGQIRLGPQEGVVFYFKP